MRFLCRPERLHGPCVPPEALSRRSKSPTHGAAGRLGISEGQGQRVIRIHAQWRICFVWTELGPLNVEIVDDH